MQLLKACFLATLSAFPAAAFPNGNPDELPTPDAACLLPVVHAAAGPMIETALPPALRALLEADPLQQIYEVVKAAHSSPEAHANRAVVASFGDVKAALGDDPFWFTAIEAPGGFAKVAAGANIPEGRLRDYHDALKFLGDFVGQSVNEPALKVEGAAALKDAGFRPLETVTDFPALTSGTTLVYFSGPNCFPCTLLKPTLGKLATAASLPDTRWYFTETPAVLESKSVEITPTLGVYTAAAEIYLAMPWPNTRDLWKQLSTALQLAKTFRGLGALTWNPHTGTYGITPCTREDIAATSLRIRH